MRHDNISDISRIYTTTAGLGLIPNTIQIRLLLNGLSVPRLLAAIATVLPSLTLLGALSMTPIDLNGPRPTLVGGVQIGPPLHMIILIGAFQPRARSIPQFPLGGGHLIIIATRCVLAVVAAVPSVAVAIPEAVHPVEVAGLQLAVVVLLIAITPEVAAHAPEVAMDIPEVVVGVSGVAIDVLGVAVIGQEVAPEALLPNLSKAIGIVRRPAAPNLMVRPPYLPKGDTRNAPLLGLRLLQPGGPLHLIPTLFNH